MGRVMRERMGRHSPLGAGDVALPWAQLQLWGAGGTNNKNSVGHVLPKRAGPEGCICHPLPVPDSWRMLPSPSDASTFHPLPVPDSWGMLPSPSAVSPKLPGSLSSCTTSLDKARHFLLDSQLQVSSVSRGLHSQVVLRVMLHWAGMARGKGRKGSCCWLLIALSTYTGTATGTQLRVRT